MRPIRLLLVLLLALSAFVPHHARAAAAPGRMTAHAGVAHHAAGHDTPARDCGGGGAVCIGCAVPDAPLAALRLAAPAAVRALSTFVPRSPRGHATALDPPPPKAA